MTLELQAQVSVLVTWRGDTRDLGIFDTFDGGDATSDNTKHRRGGGQKAVSKGGVSTLDDITVSRDFDLLRDHPNYHWLVAANGKGRFECRYVFTDEEELVANVRPLGYTGRLTGVSGLAHDANSSDVRMITLTLSPDDQIG